MINLNSAVTSVNKFTQQIKPLTYRSFGSLALGIFLCSNFGLANAAAGGNGSNPKGQPFVEINGQVLAVEGAISSLQDQVDLLVARVDTVEQRVTADEAAVATLTSQIQTIQALIDQNLTDLTAIQNETINLQDQNTYLLSLIATNSGDIAAMQIEIDSNSGLITTLQSSMLMVQDGLINLDNSLQAQIDNNANLISILGSEIDTINADLPLKQNLVNGICPNGSAVQQIMPDGTVICGAAGGGGGTGQLSVVKAYTLGVAAPGQNVNVRTPCPSGYFATGYGFTSALNWDIINLGINVNILSYFVAQNNNSYIASVYHVVSCTGLIP